MLLMLITQESIDTSFLPHEIAGMHWIETTGTEKECRLGFIEAKDGMWVLSPKSGNTLLDTQGTVLEKATLDVDVESAFVLKGPDISDHHARIDFIREKFTLTDLDSTYGTFLNGARIDPGTQYPLGCGDVVEMVGLAAKYAKYDIYQIKKRHKREDKDHGST